MSSLPAHSRRTLLAVGALAAAPIAEAKKKKGKGKKKKPQPAPLAFAVVRVADFYTASSSTYACNVEGFWIHDALGGSVGFDAAGIEVDYAAAGEQARAQLAAGVQAAVAAHMADLGYDVPADRIAVRML